MLSIKKNINRTIRYLEYKMSVVCWINIIIYYICLKLIIHSHLFVANQRKFM